MKKAVLVTGGAGYIGSHTCKALSALGYLPISLDNLVYGHSWAVQWGPLVVGDISDPLVLDQVFLDYHPIAIVHFAAYAYVGESVDNPAKYYKNNVAGSLVLLDAMRRNNCKTIIFSSSCATYGLPKQIPIPENYPQVPINPYGRSKFMVEQIIKDYSAAYGISFAILRYFNAAGADPEIQIGEDHNPETHLIPLIMQTALGQRDHIDVFGSDYDTPDGTAIRDYIHVSDLADAHVLALKYLLEARQNLCVNLGTGQGYSVLEIINKAKDITKQPIKYRITKRRAGDPSMLIAQADLAFSLFGWHPTKSRIQEIIITAWRWHRQTAEKCHV